jgi:hypothetical protein
VLTRKDYDAAVAPSPEGCAQRLQQVAGAASRLAAQELVELHAHEKDARRDEQVAGQHQQADEAAGR